MSKYDLCGLGLSSAQLIVIRDQALSSIGTGKTMNSINAPGLSTGFEVFASPMEIYRAAVYALQVLDPATYGNVTPNIAVGNCI